MITSGPWLGALLLIGMLVLVGFAVARNSDRRVKRKDDAFEKSMREIADRPRRYRAFLL